MSPIQAMERSYAALQEMLRTGELAPGARLEAARLADWFGVSITPVRDVLHRLVGERLVEASSGEGFHVPRFNEGALRDLYEWNGALLSMAVRSVLLEDRPKVLAGQPASESLADRTAIVFEHLSSVVNNGELRHAILATNDRLYPFRMIEPVVIGADDEELEEIALAGRGQVRAIRRYHLRRMRSVADLISYRERHHRGSLK
jgi:hypothetical protein